VETERPAHRFAVLLTAIAVPGFIAATLHAATSGSAGRTILGELTLPIERVIAAGAALYHAAGGWLFAVRHPAALLGVLAAVAVLRRPAEARGAQALLVALLLAGVAQVFLLAGAVWIGLALYAGAVSVALATSPPPGPAASRAADLPLALALLALFGVVCLYRLDVHPNLYVDEMAYLRAARMFAGQVEIGRILGSGTFSVYVYDQFLAQTVPLVLQAAAVSLLPSDAISTRLLSVLAVAAALGIAAIALRPPLGGRVAVGMLALAATAPLLVVYSRAGHYISISVLHSAIAFAALLSLWRRWNVPAAAVVGIVLGSSLYQYQLSWFVPVFAGLGFALSPELWRRPGVVKVVATVAISAGAVALPGLAKLESGFGAVGAQTFDRAVWNVPESGDPETIHERFTGVVAIAPAGLAAADFEAVVAEISGRELSARPEQTVHGEAVIWIGGERPGVERMAGELRSAGWALLDFDWISKDPRVRLGRMLSQLFYESSWESSGRWVAAPLLNPILAPLLVVGLALAWRRRSEPALRLALVWVVGGALLPALAGGPAPRRTSLMLPFAYALMALPLVELGAALGRRRFGRPAAAGLAALLFAAVSCTGSFLYFRQWEHQAGQLGGGGGLLDFVKVLKARPVDEVVLMPTLYAGLDSYLDAGDASPYWPERIARPLRKRPARIALRMSCEQPPPFSWMVQDRAEQRAALAAVAEHFEVEADVDSGVRVLRVTGVRDAICRRPDRRASPSEGR
jgi:hypothetical protein